MLRQRLLNNNQKHINTCEEDESAGVTTINESKAAILALFLSLGILTIKTFLTYKDGLRNLFWENKYSYLDLTFPNGKIAGFYFNEVALRTNGLWLPLVCGCLMASFTWLIVYFDSSEPGIKPPTPFSHKKYRSKRFGPPFHLGYLIAIVNGVMVFILMFINNLFST